MNCPDIKKGYEFILKRFNGRYRTPRWGCKVIERNGNNLIVEILWPESERKLVRGKVVCNGKAIEVDLVAVVKRKGKKIVDVLKAEQMIDCVRKEIDILKTRRKQLSAQLPESSPMRRKELKKEDDELFQQEYALDHILSQLLRIHPDVVKDD